ncbi:MAG: hypothetical protein RL071_4683 [Pseudomonadota bacterium]|jgi:hypothetical protein
MSALPRRAAHISVLQPLAATSRSACVAALLLGLAACEGAKPADDPLPAGGVIDEDGDPLPPDGGDGGAVDDVDGDGSPAASDCDDTNPARAPGLDDSLGDGVDQNCDGLDGVDADRDGAASAASGGPDCDDRSPSIAPAATDIAGDSLDQNCDGVDGTDVDGDGEASAASGGADCDDRDPARAPGRPDSASDGLDDDCDGVDGEDADGDGSASIESGGLDCDDADPTASDADQDRDGASACAGDCDDRDPRVGPIDSDGDGALDACGAPPDGDGDGYPGAATAGSDCDDGNPATNPAATDIVGDGLDQNCDGLDGTDVDRDGAASVASGGGDCDDRDPARAPGRPDPTADGLDQDCDGVDGPPVVDPEEPDTCACGPAELAGALAAGPVDLSSGSTMGGAPLRTVDDRLGWSQLDDVPADLADGDDDTLGALGCAADELAVATSGGGWICTRLTDLRRCPADMVAVGDSCIEINERGTETYVDAARACDAVGRRLCRADELMVACALGLTAEATDATELTSAISINVLNSATGTPCTRTSYGSSPTSGVGDYRCCMNP